jgi:OST-HTH/LOTUS domain
MFERLGSRSHNSSCTRCHKTETMTRTTLSSLEIHRLDLEDGAPAEELAGYMVEHSPAFDVKKYGFQEFAEFLNYAQDKHVVRIEPDEEKGLIVFLGAEFYPPALPEAPPTPPHEEEEDEKRHRRSRNRCVARRANAPRRPRAKGRRCAGRAARRRNSRPLTLARLAR